ncbi:MAG: BPTI/Kunitz domain-containing protein [Nitrosarchaeum sp.]|nr:BPTI/Kunitz domain-containing protein [Nitrosarchaeum sp.]
MKSLIIIGLGIIAFASIIQTSHAEEIFMYLEKDVRKVYYTGENINSASFDHASASVIFDLGENATLDLKAPIVYPIGGQLFVLINGEEVDANATTDDCFYYASFESKSPEKIEIIFAHWPEATERTDNCETFVVSPLKQFKLGVLYSDIECRDELVLVVKSTNGHFTCVKPDSVLKLFERGWALMVNQSESSRHCYQVPETGVCKASIEKYYFDWESRSCKSFTWGGCGGSVPFDTLESCIGFCN